MLTWQKRLVSCFGEVVRVFQINRSTSIPNIRSIPNNNNNNKHAYAGTNDCFTHLRALLVLHAPRHSYVKIDKLRADTSTPALPQSL
jgi:hypothetical protein